MIWFALVAVLILSATVWYLARPLTRATPVADVERKHQLELVRDRLLVQLDELDVEEGDRNIDPAVLKDERRRIEAELARVLRELDELDLARKKKKSATEPRRVWMFTLVALAVALPLSAGGLYYYGQRATLALLTDPEMLAQAGGSRQQVPPMVLEMVARLEQRLKDEPDDAEGWGRLGRAYAVLGRQQEANAAYARSYRLNPNDPRLIAEYAAFLFDGDLNNINAQVLGLFGRLLELEPDNRDALWFVGFAAHQKGDFKRAIKMWERLLKRLPADSPEAGQLRTIIERTRERLGKK